MKSLLQHNPFAFAFVATLITALVGMLMYISFEPATLAAETAGRGIIVTQTIGAEISFASGTTTLPMNGTIGGATGGESTASTTVYVTTNNVAGYTLGIQFQSGTGMDNGDGQSIAYFGTSTAQYDMIIGGAASGFAYNASSSAPTDTITTFDHNGSACEGAGSTRDNDHCWVMHGSPTSASTIVSTTDTATAEATKVGFKVMISPNSGLPNGVYYATTTLTATTK